MTFLEIIHGECPFLEMEKIILLIKGLNFKQIVYIYKTKDINIYIHVSENLNSMLFKTEFRSYDF